MKLSKLDNFKILVICKSVFCLQLCDYYFKYIELIKKLLNFNLRNVLCKFYQTTSH